MQGVSLIMPCYNAGAYLKDAVASVFQQKADCPLELIIVNDASTDAGTQAALRFIEREWAPHLPIKIVHNERNLGPSAANNVALQHASYDYIIPVDSDDMLMPPHKTRGDKGYIQRVFDAFAQNPQLDIVICDVLNFGHFESEHKFPRHFSPKTFLEKCTLWNHTAYRREDALAASGYDEDVRLASDFVFYARLLEHAEEKKGKELAVHLIPETLFCYRRHPPGISHVNGEGTHFNGWEIMVERFPRLYSKYFPRVPLQALPRYFWLKSRTVGYGKRLTVTFRGSARGRLPRKRRHRPHSALN